MKVLRFALMAGLVFGLTACAAKPTEKSSQKPGANDEPKRDGAPQRAARNDDQRDGTNKEIKGDAKAADEKALNQEQLVGTWEAVTGDAPGSTVQFAEDGKMKMTAKVGIQAITRPGTYRLDGHTLAMTYKAGDDKETHDSVNVVTLNDKELITKDQQGKIETFKRK